MDPLSFVAFAAAVLEIGVRVSGHVNGVIQIWKTADPVILALANEVTDLLVVLDHMSRTWQSISETNRTADSLTAHGKGKDASASGDTLSARFLESFHGTLVKAEEQILKLEALVVEVGHMSKTRRKYTWLHRHGEAQEIQQNLRKIRMRTTELLLSYNAVSVSKIELQIADLKTTVITLAEAQSSLILRDGPREDNISMAKSILQMARTVPNSEPVRISARPAANTCAPSCKCRCHAGRREGVRVGHSYLGHLFVGYNGVPGVSAACTDRRCRRRFGLEVTYCFPNWFLLASLTAFFTSVEGHPLQAGLFMVKREYYDKDSILLPARRGNLERVIQMVDQNPYVVNYVASVGGIHAIQGAIVGRQPKVIKYLLERGGDPDMEDDKGISSRDELLRVSLRSGIHDPFVREIMQYIDIGPMLEDVPVIFKAQCGITYVNIPDMLSRLSPAAAEKLVSEPISRFGLYPLHLAVSALNVDVVTAMLRAGADPNACMPAKWTNPALFYLPTAPRGTVVERNDRLDAIIDAFISAGFDVFRKDFMGRGLLRYACDAGQMSAVRRLVSLGVDPATTYTDPDATHGESSPELFMAIYQDRVGVLRYAVETLGVDVAGLASRPASYGQTALSWAVNLNACACLAYLLDSGGGGGGVDHLARCHYRTIAHYIADRSGVEALDVLARRAGRLVGLDWHERSEEHGFTPEDYFEKRPDAAKPELRAAWARLKMAVSSITTPAISTGKEWVDEEEIIEDLFFDAEDK